MDTWHQLADKDPASSCYYCCCTEKGTEAYQGLDLDPQGSK